MKRTAFLSIGLLALLVVLGCTPAPGPDATDEEVFADQAVAGKAISSGCNQYAVDSCAESGHTVTYRSGGYTYTRTDSCGNVARDYSCTGKTTYQVCSQQCEASEVCQYGICVNRLEYGLVSHWKLDEGTGMVAQDTIGTNNGALQGPAWTAVSISGNALAFDGRDDEVVISDDHSLAPSGGLTLVAGAKLSDDNTYSWLVGRGSANDGTPGYSYALAVNDRGDRMRFCLNTLTGYHCIISSVMFTHDWNQWVGTYDGNSMNLYQNGVLVGSSSWSGTLFTPSNTAWRSLTIGTDANTEVGNEFFGGVIDEVRIYGRALPATEVRDLFLTTGITCTAESTGNARCSPTDFHWIQSERRLEDCSLSWVDSLFCDDGCHDYGSGARCALSTGG